MRLFYKIVILIFFLNFNSCTKKDEKISIVEEKSLETQMIDAYNEGLEELEKNDVIYAARKFNEAELLYPQSVWAPRAALMAAYAYFSQLYYDDTIVELEKFLQKYKNHPRRDYAYYLLALSHYNLIIDETKDLEEILEAGGQLPTGVLNDLESQLQSLGSITDVATGQSIATDAAKNLQELKVTDAMLTGMKQMTPEQADAQVAQLS